MTNVTQLLTAIEQGDSHAASQLLPLVYEELRRLAAQKLAHEAPGQTLEATALVHEAYLRLVDPDGQQHWDSRGHFFAAAAEAMRRVLVDNARRKFWGLGPEEKLVRIQAADNILDTKWALHFNQSPDTVPKELWSASRGVEAEAAFRSMLHWDDERNVFAPGSAAVYWEISNVAEPPHGPKSVSDWKKFWGNPNADVGEGPVRYQGGNLSAKLAAGPDKLTPEDFRLLPDSAGYKAGKDGKNLGADMDLVGPGPAYERWKKTPEYQQWLKDTKQVK